MRDFFPREGRKLLSPLQVLVASVLGIFGVTVTGPRIRYWPPPSGSWGESMPPSVGTFVSVGNAIQPFSRLLESVSSIAAELPRPIVVQHGNTPCAGDWCLARPYLEMEEFTRLMGEAELLILHAGAGSIIHAIQIGKIPIVIPRQAKYGEVIDDHQLEFARALANLGKVVLVEESAELGRAIKERLIKPLAERQINTSPSLLGLIQAVLSDYAAVKNC